ncbi:MAG: histidine kinase, partial [Firmicutes bacterium]|nr:histidine kinase [Bacillota bacterium]
MVLILLALFVMGTAVVLLLSFFYQEAYGTPRLKDSVIDFEGYPDIFNGHEYAPLSGEWEFFYNKWIVTDNYEGEPCGFINLPKRWTGMEVNGKKLPSTGYASYRITVKNLNVEDILFSANISFNYYVPFRTYINGNLSRSLGEMSKERAGNSVRDISTTINHVNTSDLSESFTVVIEIGYNNIGGIMDLPVLRTTTVNNTSWNFKFRMFPLLSLGLMIGCLLFCALVPVRKQVSKWLRVSLASLTLTLILHYLTTADSAFFTIGTLGFNGMNLHAFRYLSGVLIGCALIWNLHCEGIIRAKRAEIFVVAGINIATIAGYFVAVGTVFQIIPVMISISTMFWIAYKIFKGNSPFGYFASFMSLTGFLTYAFLIQALSSQGLIRFSITLFATAGMLIFGTAIMFLSFLKARESEKILWASAKLNAEIAEIKKQSMKDQIKPHFIFNCLSAIQDIYRKNPKDGDLMLSRFASHLRANVDSDERDFIPFETELKNTLNYFELENIRHENKLNLILDIDYLDFQIPPLSLQPFLENAVKHAGVESVEGGQIQMSSAVHKNGDVSISVLDNGCGFDLENIREGAVGLSNAKKRLEHSLSASVTVKSAPNLGTEIIIIIPFDSVVRERERERERE